MLSLQGEITKHQSGADDDDDDDDEEKKAEKSGGERANE